MTLRMGVVIACVGIMAVAVVWMRTEKRRCRSVATRLEFRKVELQAERWRLASELAQRTNPAELRSRAELMGVTVEPTLSASEERGGDRKAATVRKATPTTTGQGLRSGVRNRQTTKAEWRRVLGAPKAGL